MIDWGNPETLWILTNRCLGAVVVVSGLVLAHDIVRQVRLQYRPQERPATLDDHAFLVSDLGMTMADGGKRTDASSSVPPASTSEK